MVIFRRIHVGLQPTNKSVFHLMACGAFLALVLVQVTVATSNEVNEHAILIIPLVVVFHRNSEKES